MEQKNIAFAKYADKKFLKRLCIFARYRKESQDDQRGKSILDAKNPDKYQADFLRSLLRGFKTWSQLYHTIDGKESSYARAFEALVKEKVAFPAEDGIQPSLTTPSFL